MTLALSLLLCAALAVHAAVSVCELHRTMLFERFRARITDRRIRRAPQSAPPQAAVALECDVLPLAPAVVAAIPLAEATQPALAPTFTAPPMTDLGMRGLCLCGSYSLHRQLFSEAATCSACARTWVLCGSRMWFVPVGKLQAHGRGAEQELS